MVIGISLLALLLLLALAVVVLYNRLVRLRNRAENSWAQVDVQLRRRWDLIPNLVERSRATRPERATFEEVTKARAAAQQAQGPEEAGEGGEHADCLRSAACSRSEDYPELRATENFQQLQGQLAEVEQNIVISRQVYNDAVLSYDNALETVPTNIVAGVFNFTPREYFETEGTTRGAVRPVLLSRLAGFVLALAAAFLAPATASAKSYSLPNADVLVHVQPNGTLLVREVITFDFSGRSAGPTATFLCAGARRSPTSRSAKEAPYRLERTPSSAASACRTASA